MSVKYIQKSEMNRQNDYMRSVRELFNEPTHYYIYTYGCQQNDNDSEKLAGLLEQMGFQRAKRPEEADLILLNTCSVRGNADDRFYGNLGMVKAMRDHNPRMIVGVCGCMPEVEEHREKIQQSYSFVDLMFGTSDIYRLPELLFRRLSGSRRVYDIGTEDVIAEDLPVLHERAYRALCTIMHGCNNFCSYCIVPYTRGRERSREFELVLSELRDLARQGFSEVMLLGQNVNAYGKDLPGDPQAHSFATLLRQAARTTGLRRIRFMTPHPKDVGADLLDVMAEHDNIEQHLHLPLQSGSDRILGLMNRHYTAERYLEIVRGAKERMPDISITTDIIVGFPGETEADFQQTLNLVEAVGFDSAFTFQYSPRYGTPAAEEIEQISREVVTERFNRLLELQNQNSLNANLRRVDRTYEVLIEGLSDHNALQLTGRASDNHLINFTVPADLFERFGLRADDYASLGDLLEGKFADVKIIEARTFSLKGEYINLSDE